jgi:integrase
MSRVTYFIKRPGSGRTSFALVRKDDSGQKTVEHERIRALNAAMLSRALEVADADHQAMELVRELNATERKKRMGSYVASEANLRLLKRYWEEAYGRRKIIDKDSAHYRLRRAIEALGPTPLLGAVDVVQARIDQASKGSVRRQRALAATVNQLRRHFGVSERVNLEGRTLPEFRFLTRDEFIRVNGAVADEHLQLLFSALFHTGVRLGEAYALKREHYRAPALSVMGQVDKQGARRATKNKRVRKTLVIAEGADDLALWLGLPQSEREAAASRKALPKIWKRACKEAFPRNNEKWTNVHDLRHSYAVHMLERGVSMSLIAKLLGNSLAVCEAYYLNFAHSDDTLTAVAASLNL